MILRGCWESREVWEGSGATPWGSWRDLKGYRGGRGVKSQRVAGVGRAKAKEWREWLGGNSLKKYEKRRRVV